MAKDVIYHRRQYILYFRFEKFKDLITLKIGFIHSNLFHLLRHCSLMLTLFYINKKYYNL